MNKLLNSVSQRLLVLSILLNNDFFSQWLYTRLQALFG